MFRPPLLNMEKVQEKNTFLHVPETPMSTIPQPLRTTPASFAPPNVLPQRKRPDPIDALLDVRPVMASPMVVGPDTSKANLHTATSTYAPTMAYFGETPTTAKATNLKLADFVATPKTTTGMPTLANPGGNLGSTQAYLNNASTSQVYHGFSNSSAAQQAASSGGIGGHLPMYNSAVVSSTAPTTHISVHPVPDVSWSQNVEIALAAESAKISAPYTAVGKSLTRSIPMA
eukprot:GEMP01034210.1.p1 GENE.GEMP01034210.1~~GEMP01034210.1.p1  ORF type:complete len:230 (+),score=53.30 GEMP01034210.1:49-738(+)